MLIYRAYFYRAFTILAVALAIASVMVLTTSTYGQAPTIRPTGQVKEATVAQGIKPGNTPETKVAVDDPKSDDLKSDVAAIKAENAAVKEQLRKMDQQQRQLLELVERLQKKLDSSPATLQAVGQTIGPPSPGDASRIPIPVNPGADAGNTSSAQPKSKSVQQLLDDRYQEGIIVWQTPDDAPVPFLLRFNNNTQIRYLNTMNSDDTFTDHLGNVREVHNRNDITVNRSMFILGGYIWDKRLKYSLTVWTSAGASSIVVAGTIGWSFNKHLTLTGGYTGVPGSRSLVNTFPYYTSTDRSLADNFFRPGFTQGLWATGELTKGLNYQAFVGNSSNTLSISANKIDTNLLVAGSVWWEPLGNFSVPGKSVNMYDDYFAQKKVRIRLGTSFTRSREDRFSNLDVSSPDNTALYNSDGVLTFSTGAFAAGVTVSKALYKMWAIDGGLKYNGFSVNGQYFMRWLGDFEADGPLPLSSTFDHGYELSAGYFVIPKTLMVYARGSQVFGQFSTPYEYAAGVKWHFLPTERLWLNVEMMRVKGAPYSGAFSPYTSGMGGWVPMIQSVIAF